MIDDRVHKLHKQQAFINVKDHKDNSTKNLQSRLFNLSKNSINYISKVILERTYKYTGNGNATEINQWKNIKDTINWFYKIKKVKRMPLYAIRCLQFLPVDHK